MCPITNTTLNVNNRNEYQRFSTRRRVASLDSLHRASYKPKSSGLALLDLASDRHRRRLEQNPTAYEASQQAMSEALVQALCQELRQTRTMVAELETRLEATQQSNRAIADELRQLLSAYQSENESHTTAVDNEDGTFAKSDHYETTTTTVAMSKQPLRIVVEEPTTPTAPTTPMTPRAPTVSPEVHDAADADADAVSDTSQSFDRICTTLQELINDAQVALRRSAPNTRRFLETSTPAKRSRASSWSSSVGSWIMNRYSPTPSRCDCGTCWSCVLERQKAKDRPSRRNSVSSVRCGNDVARRNGGTLQLQQRIMQQCERRNPERFADYRQSVENLDLALQSLMTTAFADADDLGIDWDTDDDDGDNDRTMWSYGSSSTYGNAYENARHNAHHNAYDNAELQARLKRVSSPRLDASQIDGNAGTLTAMDIETCERLWDYYDSDYTWGKFACQDFVDNDSDESSPSPSPSSGNDLGSPRRFPSSFVAMLTVARGIVSLGVGTAHGSYLTLTRRCLNVLAMLGILGSVSTRTVSEPMRRVADVASAIRIVKYLVVLLLGWVVGKTGAGAGAKNVPKTTILRIAKLRT